MRILITGAGGFIGRACVSGFASAGWQVRTVSRQTATVRPNVEQVVLGDPCKADWSSLLHDVDCILHLVGVSHRPAACPADYNNINVKLTATLARAAVLEGVGHFVYLSSISVYGRERRCVNESMPICPDDNNGRSKALAEATLREIAMDTSMHWTIVRPPLVYGSNAPGNFRRLAGLVRRGTPLPLAGASELRSYIGIDNLVSALLCIMGNPNAVDKIYLVADGDDLCTADLIRAMARGVGRSARLWWLPAGLIRLGATLLGCRGDAERLFGRLQVDTRLINQDLGWMPATSAREGIALAMTGNAGELN
jgi:nucleoside-diphosphate-sugar epimerase